MKTRWLIACLFLLLIGCRKDHELPPDKVPPLPSYIKTLLVPDTSDTYEGSFYIYAGFTDNGTSETRNINFDERNASMAIRYDSSHKGTGLSEHTVMFIDPAAGERLEISFYYDLAADTAFRICYADYFYGGTPTGNAGVNIMYYKPVSQGDTIRYYIYQGINTADSYFRITHLGNNTVNGTFHTTWKENIGDATTYKVTGDFSIPLMVTSAKTASGEF